jgi:prophage regulatory protein
VQQISPKDREPRTERPDRILRDSEVRERTGLSRTTRWRLIKAGKFPAPVRLTEHAVGTRESELNAWVAARLPNHVEAAQ